MALLSASPTLAGTGATSMPNGLPGIVQPLLESVVNIAVLKRRVDDPQAAPETTLGSGFVISADGLVVTNKHVVENGYNVTVAFNDGSNFPARVLAVNQRPDLALLKIDPGRPISFVTFGDSDALEIGETVIAIGNPLGLSSSVSVGIVSALNRNINVTTIDDFIQTDAAINHGNSGGPLFNAKGEVIGVNWALVAPGEQAGSAGLGFAIPSRDAAWVIDEMKRFGRLRAGFIGVRMQQVTADVQAGLGLPSRAGGIVTGVLPGAPAAKAGLQDGDVVMALNGNAPRDVRALVRGFLATPPGSMIVLSIWRDGAMLDTTVTVDAWPDADSDPAGPPWKPAPTGHPLPDIGLELDEAGKRSLSSSRFHAGRGGVLVRAVAPDSQAADLHFVPGDVILQIGSHAISTPDEFRRYLGDARSARKSTILILVETKGEPHWVAFHPQVD